MRHPAQFSRREFLKTSTQTAGALVLGFSLPTRAQVREPASGGPFKVFQPNAWLRITADNQITILVEKPELGQGSRTYTPMMIAEELEVDWSTIHVEQAPTIPSIYQGLRTGGSGGVVSTFTPMRQVGAQAREMLIMAAAQQWKVKKRDCRAEHGTVVHGPTNRRVSYGELVEAASILPLINPDEIALKQPKDFRFIGKPIPRTDVPSKVDGSAAFGIDVRVPGMLFAVIARCPFFGGKLQSFEVSAAKLVPGVLAVFPVPPLPRRFNTAGGVAVVADSTWAAMQGRKALVLTWDKGPGGKESTENLHKLVAQQSVAPPTFIALDRGDALDILADPLKKVEASYESPFQAHATMEPMNTTVDVRDHEIEVWSPTQFADEVQEEIAKLSGFPLDKVTVHMTLSGGSFGRRYQWGMLVGAVHLYRMRDEAQERELRSSKLEAQLSASQLEVLRAKIHPHFLFNTLQAATMLIHEDPDGAEDILLRLSELLRVSIDEAHIQEVRLERELEVLDLYMGIQVRRFGDRLRFEVSIDQNVRDCMVPALVLQPLVENAIRHGIGRHKGSDTVSVRAFQEGEFLRLEVRNLNSSLEDTSAGLLGRGVGLANTRARLEQLYGNRQEFGLRNLEPTGVSAMLSIPLRSAPVPVEEPFR